MIKPSIFPRSSNSQFPKIFTIFRKLTKIPLDVNLRSTASVLIQGYVLEFGEGAFSRLDCFGVAGCISSVFLYFVFKSLATQVFEYKIENERMWEVVLLSTE